MLVREIMSIYPVSIDIHADLRRAAEIITLADASDVMVIADDLPLPGGTGPGGRRFVGVLSEGDLIRAILPDFDEVLAAGGTLRDAFRFFVARGRELASRPIEPMVVKDPIVAAPDDEVAQVATILIQKRIHRLPVVQGQTLLGTVSRTDICRAVIYHA